MDRLSPISTRPAVLLRTPRLSQILEETTTSIGGAKYKYLTLKYNTVTRSGYDVERIAHVAATVHQRLLCSLVATVSSERRNKMDSDLAAIRASFRVANAVDMETVDRTG